MREIKFRAWDTVKKIMYSAEELGADQETLSADGRGFINVSGESTRNSQFHIHLLPLECTGLKDKNGKEGYHKDIADDGGRKFVVEWLDERAQFVLIPVGASKALALPMECLKDMEVIGNLYENPELLEK